MPTSLPTFVNNSAPPIDAAFLNSISRTVERHDATTADVKSYGAIGNGVADDTTAVQNAINAGANTIYFPPGTYLVSTLNIANVGTKLLGAGRGISTILGSGTSNLITFSAGINKVTLQSITFQTPATGGHIFAPAGSVNTLNAFDISCVQNNPAKSIWNHADFGYIDNLWIGCILTHNGAASVPSFNFVTAVNAANQNTWERCQCNHVATATSPFFLVENDGASTFNYGNTFRDLTFEICNGGMIRLLSANACLIDNCKSYDLTTTTANSIFIGAGTGANASRDNTIRQYHRIGGTIGGGLFDVALGASGKAVTTTLQDCNQSNGAGITADLQSNQRAVIIGCDNIALTNKHQSTVLVDRGRFSGETVQVLAKAGAPVDADFNVTPGDGSLAVDTTGRQLYLRSSGTWSNPVILNSVKNYGAKGDGTTDDTVAIQACITAAAALNKPASVYFPAGTYVTSAALNVAPPAQLTLYGDGYRASKLTLKNASNTAMLMTPDDAVQRYGLQVKGLAFDGNAANQTGTNAIIVLRGMNEAKIDDCYLANPRGSGIFTGQATGGIFCTVPTVRNCIIRGDVAASQGDGITFSSGSSDSITIGNDIGQFSLGAGITWTGHPGWGSSMNQVWQCLHGYQVYRSDRGRMTGNLSDLAKRYGLIIQSSSDIIVDTTQTRESSQQTANTYDGIFMQGEDASHICRNVQFNGCRSMGAQARYGIVFDTFNDRCFVDGGNYTGNQTGPFLGTSATATNYRRSDLDAPSTLVDITDFGAVVGGDAAAAVTSAISNLGSSGGTILIPRGDWLWNTTPLLPKNLTNKLHIKGESGTKVTLTATGLRLFDFNRTADYDTFKDLEISDLLVDVNNLSAPSSNHVVVGMMTAGSETTGQRVNVQNLTVQRIKTINVPVDGTNLRRNVWIISRHLTSNEATQTYLKDITVKDCNFSGGAMGVVVAGTSAISGNTNAFIDNILVENIKHDCLTNPTGNFAASHVHIGSRGHGGSCTVRNIWGFGSRDVGIEINAMSHALIDGYTIENANGFYFVHCNYNVPAEPGGQQIEVRNGKAIWSGGVHIANASSAIAGVVVTNPLGSLTFDNCSLYKSDPSFTEDGIAGRFMGAMKKLVINQFEYVDDHINISTASVSPTPFWFETANQTPISMEKMKVKIAGSITGAGTIQQIAVFGIYGSAVLDWDDLNIDISGIAANNHGIRVFNVGQVAGTVLGPSVIRRAKMKITDATTPDLFRIFQAANLSFTGPLRIVDPDWTGVTSLGNEIEYAIGTENATNIGLETNYWANAVPTTGFHCTNEKVWNTSPTAGGNLGWICITGGNPGTWKAFGVIAA